MPANTIKALFERLDTQRTLAAPVGNSMHAAKQAVAAQTLPQFVVALDTYAQQVTTISRQLSLFAHPDKVGNTSERAAFSQLMEIRDSIGTHVQSWAAQWPES